MGNTRNTGHLRNIVQYDASNNIVMPAGLKINGVDDVMTSAAMTSTLGGYVSSARTITINGTAFDLSADRSWTIVGGVTAVSATSPIISSGGATPDISIAKATGTVDGYLSAADYTIFNAKQDNLTFYSPLVKSGVSVTIPQATGTVDGFLDSADWTTFNNKQNALTNPVTGAGTPDYLPKFTGASTIGNSSIQEVEGAVQINNGLISGLPEFRYNQALYARFYITTNSVNDKIGITLGENVTSTNYANIVGTIVDKTGAEYKGRLEFQVRNGNSTFSTPLTLEANGDATFFNSLTAASMAFDNAGTTPITKTGFSQLFFRTGGNTSMIIRQSNTQNIQLNFPNNGSALQYDFPAGTSGGTLVLSTSLAAYLTGITSTQVTTALGFTPYNASNPSGYVTSSGSISGNADTATNASQLNGFSKSQLWNNSGQGHSAYTSFAGPDNFGNYFIHQDLGVNDGPAGLNYQYYSTTVGLGNEYGYGSYAMQTAINRYGYGTTFYTWVRYKENGTWTSWNKMAAGYADSAGTATDSTKVPLSGGTMTGQITWANGTAPISFQQGGNSGTYTQTTIYANQNNTSGDDANGIFIERGYTNTSNTEIRKFVIGVRGGGIQWKLDGTGNVTQAGGLTATYLTTNGEGNFGPDSGTDSGIKIRYANDSGGYGRIRFHQGGTNVSTIHSFSALWQGGTLAGQSSGAINIDGQSGVTFGGWSVPDGYIVKGGSAWFRYDVTAYSDARIKDNIIKIENAIDKINAIRGVTFTRKDKADGKRYAGVIAQEVLEVLPEVVTKGDDGMYSVSYGNMGGLFIEGLKEHDVTIKAQEKQLKAQAEEIKELKTIINGLTK